ncbi:family 16 glycoside hydrolase [Maribacter antarcticus]|uniref:family 16 glycoside hydrolase n=1 Tax=Maribacter antarcticus TaxID=505250 RepID=UPI000479CC03|nr:family 16 glycoside hydrolase [Maribacter antarcticus]
MKYHIIYCLGLLIGVVSSCSEPTQQAEKTPEQKQLVVLPFQTVALNDMADFKEGEGNWQIVGEAYVNRVLEKTISSTEGSGVLINLPVQGKTGNLVTTFSHGDIEFECDVMMPVKSNSGIYFQSRYEVQLFDSWGVDSPQYEDMGGIYQRWDETRGISKEGFEGVAPNVNSSKSPGLWQHLKVIFHAPKFDSAGTKVKNAWFEEVILNGAVLHRNVEVSGPTRASLETGEESKAPLLFQGDHGPVAFKNLKYKLYADRKVELIDVRLKEYENTLTLFPSLDSLVPIRAIGTDSISATMASGERAQKLLNYEGKLKIPESGDYIFDFKINTAGGAFLINNDTVISMNGNYSLDSLRVSKISLVKGEVPFQLIYNKHIPWTVGFGLFVEGPGIQKHPLHAVSSLNLTTEGINPEYVISIDDEPITQRGFWMHEGGKRTHCIAVGSARGVHYSYDLEVGSLLQVWSGDFMDATQMWQGRGEKQLAVPAGFIVSLHGDPEVADLKEDTAIWPTMNLNRNYKQLGYEFDSVGYPFFSYQIEGSKVSNRFVPSTENRGLKREIMINGGNELWFKVADGSVIKELPDGTFVVNNESYFIDFEINNLNPIIRKSNGLDELVVKIPSGEQQLNYSIIW